jgi:hypothetical protein
MRAAGNSPAGGRGCDDSDPVDAGDVDPDRICRVPYATPTLLPTETLTPEPTENKPLKRTVIKVFTGCYYGPGPEYTLDSNISPGKKVDIVGVGSVPGWYVIVNPYFHKQCWVNANDLEIDPARDLTTLPVMTPIP